MSKGKVSPVLKTPSRRVGPRAAGINPRQGEDINRGGQKSYQGGPGGMKPTQPPKKKNK